MASAAESITESLRRSRQLMVQEVERSANTLSTFDESTSVLRQAEGEYQGHRSLLVRTRGLLSTMQRQDVLDRIILTTEFLRFSLAVLYVSRDRLACQHCKGSWLVLSDQAQYQLGTSWVKCRMDLPQQQMLLPCMMNCDLLTSIHCLYYISFLHPEASLPFRVVNS